VAEEQKARNVAPLGGSVSEVATDVTKRGCTQQRIANGVGENVAIRVPHRALCEGNPHAAQNQFAAGCETMKVIPDPNAEKTLNSEF
jgi:hypothetical protein